jgi:hypothetical protein
MAAARATRAACRSREGGGGDKGACTGARGASGAVEQGGRASADGCRRTNSQWRYGEVRGEGEETGL